MINLATVRNVGRAKGFKLVGSALHEACSVTGSISKFTFLLSAPTVFANVLNSSIFRNFSIEGPVGPSAFWKVTNEIGDMGSDLGDHMDGEDNDNSDENYDEGQDVDDDSQDDEPFFGTIITISLS